MLAALVLAFAAPARAELRISDLDVFLNDHDITAQVVLLNALPPAFSESIHSGIPAHVRFTIELWHYRRLQPDRLVVTKVIERALTYNVVTKEYKVAVVKGDPRPVYTTRELREAQRVLSEARGAKLVQVSGLDAADVVYVRVKAEAALNGENTFLTRLAGQAEQIVVESEYRTMTRIQ
ncbi:MAG: DUF4390 domain-containing protein [Candidatus Rokuibacteriota bacterium]